MAAIPPNHGGDRAFIANPQGATNADAIGDLAATMQLLMHIVEAIPGANAPLVTAGRERVNTARAAVEAIAQRDVGQREPPPLTDLPAVGANPLGNTRFQHIPKFETRKNEKPPPGEVFAWLSACAVTARTAGLNQDGFFSLLLSTCTGSAFNYVEHCRQAGLTILETVRNLESRYGDLLNPADAGAELTVYQRPSGSPASAVLDDLRRLAKFQLRLHPEEGRQERIEELVRLHLLRVLPIDVTAVLNEDIRQANATGAKVPSNDFLATRAERLEKHGSRSAVKEHQHRRERQHHERQVTVTHPIPTGPPPSSDMIRYVALSDEELQRAVSDALAPEPELDEESDELVESVLAIQQVIARQNRHAPMKNVLTAAIRQHNNRQQGRPINQVAGSNPPVRQGPPNKLGRTLALTELLRLANVNRGECILCGIPGHLRGNINCALRGQPLMDMPCTRCGKGLHSADNCHLTAEAVANACVEEPLNG